MMVLFWHSITHFIHIETYDSKEFICLVRVKMPVIYKKNQASLNGQTTISE